MTDRIDPETGEVLHPSFYEDAARDIEKTITGLFLRTPYNYDMDAASERTGLACPEPTLAQQHAAEDADINTIVRRFGITGQMPQLERIPLQGDFADVKDFQSAMNALLNAQEAFDKLPADIRKQFDNDPGKFLDFTSDEKNLPELRKMGLAKPEPAPAEPALVRIVPDTAEKPGGVT